MRLACFQTLYYLQTLFTSDIETGRKIPPNFKPKNPNGKCLKAALHKITEL